MRMISTDDYPEGITFPTVLTAMRAGASRFENVIELDPLQSVADDMIYAMHEGELDYGDHVGVTGADFLKLEKLFWDGGWDVEYYTKCYRVAAARFCFDKPDMEVEIRNYAWSDLDERDRYSEEEKKREREREG
ncbi:hypothetical protein B5807_11627 [Epicoccum nigrum]|jgi:hypothetical protein|uniref:Uncharacterized protein n=1 Tax=Epicoccum nigrum TaxID=105696 RepID=A0A1Y2LIY2_EPING|nr:hypothetical protein B5807_11627 [Epicoccum nigrum]